MGHKQVACAGVTNKIIKRKQNQTQSDIPFHMFSGQILGWSMTLWKILKFNKTHLHKFKYVLSDVVNL